MSSLYFLSCSILGMIGDHSCPVNILLTERKLLCQSRVSVWCETVRCTIPGKFSLSKQMNKENSVFRMIHYYSKLLRIVFTDVDYSSLFAIAGVEALASRWDELFQEGFVSVIHRV